MHTDAEARILLPAGDHDRGVGIVNPHHFSSKRIVEENILHGPKLLGQGVTITIAEGHNEAFLGLHKDLLVGEAEVFYILKSTFFQVLSNELRVDDLVGLVCRKAYELIEAILGVLVELRNGIVHAGHLKVDVTDHHHFSELGLWIKMPGGKRVNIFDFFHFRHDQKVLFKLLNGSSVIINVKGLLTELCGRDAMIELMFEYQHALPFFTGRSSGL